MFLLKWNFKNWNCITSIDQFRRVSMSYVKSSCEHNVALDLVGETFSLIVVEGSTFLGKKKKKI